MELRELGYFVAVYEEKSVTAAAKRCFVSQPSVSAALAQLEHELGAQLFVRHRKGARPTAAAEQLYPVARRLRDETDALRATFRKPAPRRTLTVGLAATLDIPRTMAVLAESTADANLDVRLVGADDACEVRIVERSQVRKGEAFRKLWSERFVAALPAAHPLALKPRLRPSDLVGQRFVHRCHCEMASRVRASQQKLVVAAVAASEEWAVALVAAGIGIALLPEGVVRPSAHVVLRAIDGVHVLREVGIAYGAEAPSREALLFLRRSKGATRATRAA